MDLFEKIPEEERVDPLERVKKHLPEVTEVFDQIIFASGLTGTGVIQLEVSLQQLKDLRYLELFSKFSTTTRVDLF